MSKKSKPPLIIEDSSFSPDLLEEIEKPLKCLLEAEESEGFELGMMANLADILEGNPVLADKFFEKVLARPNLRTARLLFELDGLIHSKPLHKGIKRTLYLLKQRGMDIPSASEDKAEKTGRGILKETASVQVSGYLSEFDELRNRMLALIIPQVSKGRLFLFALIDPENSLESLTALAVSKKEAIGLLKDLEEQAGHSFLSADPGQAAFILKEAHDRKSKLSKEDEGIYGQVNNLLTGLKTVRSSPIIRSLFPATEPLSEMPPDWEQLSRIAEVAYYLPKAEELEPFQKALRQVQESILIVSQAQKKAQIQEIVLRGARDIFEGRKRQELIRYLEELAYLYFLKSQRETAEVLFSAALFLAKEAEKAISEANPFLIGLVEKALSIEKMMEDSSDQGSAAEMTPGGIIIPPWVKRGGET